LAEHGKHMCDYGLPEPRTWIRELIAEHRRYSDYTRYKQLANEFCGKMTLEQITFYKKVIECVTWKKENKSIPKNEFPIFLDGKAGHSKTFLINAISYAIRAMKEIIFLCGT